MDTVNAVLAKKLGLPIEVSDEPEEVVVLTPMRQMRRAMARAADTSVGMLASVLSIADETLEAEQLINDGPKGWIVIGLRDDTSAGLMGLFLIDPALRSALVEMQTMGKLIAPSGEERVVTRTDAMLCIPFVSQLFAELGELGFAQGVLDPTPYDMGPMEDLRTAGLVMTQGQYHSWKVSVQVGDGDRTGEMQFALLPQGATQASALAVNSHWSGPFRAAIQQAPTDLEAVLPRLTLPMAQVEAFKVGQLLSLAGTTVSSVRLCGPGGDVVSTARLGQIAGKRAVRLQHEVNEMRDDIRSTPDLMGGGMSGGGGMMGGGGMIDGPDDVGAIDMMAEPMMPDPMMNDPMMNDPQDPSETMGMEGAADIPMEVEPLEVEPMGVEPIGTDAMGGGEDAGFPSHEDALLESGLDADLPQDFPNGGPGSNMIDDQLP